MNIVSQFIMTSVTGNTSHYILPSQTNSGGGCLGVMAFPCINLRVLKEPFVFSHFQTNAFILPVQRNQSKQFTLEGSTNSPLLGVKYIHVYTTLGW